MKDNINLKDDINTLFTEQQLKGRVAELGQLINKYYPNGSHEVVLVGLLRGSFIFMADLCRAIERPHQVDFMAISSYGSGMTSTGNVTILKDLDGDIRGKEVLIVEDIIDSGRTLHKVCEILRSREPASLEICTLLDKPTCREVEVPVRWVGFKILDKNQFVVGYGIDYA